jgi:hypothetical protein
MKVSLFSATKIAEFRNGWTGFVGGDCRVFRRAHDIPL